MKTVNYQIARVRKSIVASLMIMASFAGIAKGENSNEFSGNEYNAKAFVESEIAIETATWNNSGTETDYTMDEADFSTLKYNAKDFADAEFAAEAGNLINSNDDNVAELALEIDAYDARIFAEADFTAEASSLINSNDDDTVELAFEVEAYDARKYVQTEIANDTQNWIAQTSNGTITPGTTSCDNVMACK